MWAHIREPLYYEVTLQIIIMYIPTRKKLELKRSEDEDEFSLIIDTTRYCC